MVGSITSVTASGISGGRDDPLRWRAAFWMVWALLLILKIVLAGTLAPFGDEAWYWQESRALDWSFSDLPLATAALIRLGETLFGHGVLAMRAPFLLFGALTPLILVHTGTRLFGVRAGWFTGLIALALPLLGTLGMFALPDVPLTLCAALGLDMLERAARTGNRGAWCVLGLVLAAALLSHYRAAMLLLTGLAFLLLTVRGRQLWRDPGLWTAVAISLLGLLPLLIFNLEHGWVALSFQILERNPWAFHADGFAQPLEQAIVCTPLFYLLLLWAAWRCVQRGDAGAPWDLLAVCSVVPWIAWLVLGFFADDTRLRLHWPLPAYLPLLVALPALLEPARAERGLRGFALAAFVMLAAGSVLAFAYFSAAAVPGGAVSLARFKAFPEHWVGWNEVAVETGTLLQQERFREATLVADNFMLAAELDFAFASRRPVYALDHPINTKHGRAPQLALWRRDERALRDLAPGRLLVVIEPTARRERERAAWLERVCSTLRAPQVVGRLELYEGRKRYLFVAADGLADAPRATSAAAAGDACRDFR
ncbi:MAG TPA: glycosyltransferase family 39 protein [Rudaea sp.]|nr:glycosyltransferase family 39 protein [Rudaea sp.]